VIKIAASILSADFARLGEQVAEAEAAGADYIHVDVMDGHFVPNITAGPVIVEAVRRVTDLPLDVHLMIEEPERYLARFADAGSTILTVHVETCPHLHRTVQQIHELGVKAGVTLNPATSLSTLEEIDAGRGGVPGRTGGGRDAGLPIREAVARLRGSIFNPPRPKNPQESRTGQ